MGVVVKWGLLLVLPIFLGTCTHIHLVPHSHDDVGWLKTPAQYYYGWNNSIQHANVQLIYSSAVSALQSNPARRFIAVEMAFFSKWYYEQSMDLRSVVQGLVASGQLLFAGGGWCSHDEATTTYQDILEQMTLGHQFILAEFGTSALPKIQWQVDPFGHSAGQVLILSESSDVEALYFSRIDYIDFAERQRKQTREFFWMPSPSLGEKAVVFTSMMLHGTYCPPIDMNFDILLNEPTVVDSECGASTDDQLPTAAGCGDHQNTALSWIRRLAAMMESDWDATSGDDIMWTMGCDFTYMQAETWYSNMDRIQRLVGRRVETSGHSLWAAVNVSYATPQSYTNARFDVLRRQTREDDRSEVMDTMRPLHVKEGDFFPYADGPHMYWTGFYASRPAFKRVVRLASGLLTALNQAAATLATHNHTNAFVVSLGPLRQAVAQSQHHDAVTGTAKQHVSFDYTKSLAAAMVHAIAALGNTLAGGDHGLQSASYHACFLSNESVCPVTQLNSPFHIFGWNSRDMSSTVGHLIFEVPVNYSGWAWEVVRSSSGDTAQSMATLTSVIVVPSSPCLSQDGSWCAPFTALVRLDGVALGAPFILSATPLPEETESDAAVFAQETLLAASVVETAAVRLTFDSSTGCLLSVKNKQDNVERNVTLHVCYYVGSRGDSASSQASGAYIFRPNQSEGCVPVWNGSTAAPVAVRSAQSAVAIVLDQNVSEWMTLRWFVFENEPRIELEVSISELPITSPHPDSSTEAQGRELVLRWVTNVDSGNEFWTDANGLELMPRRRVESASEPIAANFFPVPTAALIRDASSEWLMVSDGAVGCSSLSAGALECMIHRRLLVDDGRGVGEPLNETEFITPYTNCAWCSGSCCGVHTGRPMVLRRRFVLSLHRPSNMTWRQHAESHRRQPLLLFGRGAASLNVTSAVSDLFPPRWNVSALPQAVSLDSVEVGAEPHSLWIRLAHIGSCFSNDSCFAMHATVDLGRVFPGLVSATRRTLLFTKPFSNATSRAKSVGKISGSWGSSYARPVGGLEGFLATLYPMEVHAYALNF